METMEKSLPEISPPTDLEKGTDPNIASSASSNRDYDDNLQITCASPGLSRTPTAANPIGNDGVLGKTLSLIRTKDSGIDPGPPPDGGFNAWFQTCLSHLVMCNTWGYLNSFGVFQSHYMTSLQRSPSDISWVGSIQIFLLFFIGTFSGRATDAGYFKAVWTIGAILLVLGIFMTSLATTYWQLFLSQGLCMGIGCGLLFCPTIALIPTYFSSKRAIALAISAAGSATGGIIFPAIVQSLLPRIGYPWTMRVLGFFSLSTLTPCFIFLRQRLPPRKSGPFFDWPAFKERKYSLFAIAMFLNFWGLYVAFFYLSSFGRDITGLSRKKSIDLLLILNGVGFIGRLVPSFMSDYYSGPFNAFIPCSFLSSILLFGWAGIHDVNGLYAFSILYGFFAAGIQSLFPACLSALSPDLKKTGIRFGMILSIVSFASLTGSPIAGALIQMNDGKYLYAQLFGGLSMLVGSMVLVCARISVTGPVLMVRI
ncbi:conserved hypothetical protein [Histoplasma capsulatum G186AR]|uniref:MFS monocarboxylate transporter n=2 Tax=Ajellomyces capsulatus TaxID=5037 RepID=C0NJ10_AJECG|nr:uncharacterized protein HCBG_03140 [Histoplasma capsulatum G186AR]EEH07851.1 conserved hypothetical protein [Histoplasma capsulatum G186AR]KAG5299812.1 MFS monocarboxylate transporter [Histoplasma capsulatum]QSS67561.1 MFS monocarboxylate transporter [Histoplasma capsulatum G186AR]